MIKHFLTIIYCVFATLICSATHNRGGYITYRHISGNTFEFTITTCTDVGQDVTTDKADLTINYGDGTTEVVARDSIYKTAGEFQKNIYRSIHTYTGAGTFIITMEDPNRNEGIVNIIQSVDKVFCVETELVISPFLGRANNSVFFDNCPCPEIVCAGTPYFYNPVAVDVDGDSLSYELVSALGEGCKPFPPGVYKLPNIDGGGNISIDPQTGTVLWDSPMMAGEFNMAMKITEWRQGYKIGSVIHDFQLTVDGGCFDKPPVIDPIADTCIIAGDTLRLKIKATDVDKETVSLSANGGAFVVSDPAKFVSTPTQETVTGTFTWSTNCSHIRQNKYKVYFVATDEADNIPLSGYTALNIRVAPPPPGSISVSPYGNGFNLSWSAGECAQPYGYRIYRIGKEMAGPTECCKADPLTSIGFEFVAELKGHESTGYYDNTGDLSLGVRYCYLVTVLYDFGKVESCPSDTSCGFLIKDVPIITHVSVANTDQAAGIDSVQWIAPTEVDTVQYPGPYHYKVYQRGAFDEPDKLVRTTADYQFLGGSDGVYVDSNINTVDNPNAYRVEIYYDSLGQKTLIGTSNPASSIYLSAAPNDNRIDLSWKLKVPWTNVKYHIYKSTNSINGTYQFLDSTTNEFYSDSGLVNGKEYCYYVVGYGYYADQSIPAPLINISQRLCAESWDLTPPCPPKVNISGGCEPGENYLIWNNPNNDCSDDVMSYTVYFLPKLGDSFVQIAVLNSALDTTFTHSDDGSVAGCYYVTATDSLQYNNESDTSNIVCMDNCPLYFLPNVFTPNGDTKNDLFVPLRPYAYVHKVDFTIYNRWGDVIFETDDPALGWDGTMDGAEASEGVYYYVCRAHTKRLSGPEFIDLKGWFHLFRSGGGTGK